MRHFSARTLALVITILGVATSTPAQRMAGAAEPVRKEAGPTPAEVDAAVARGLTWLIKAQAADGHWSLMNEQHNVAATALGLLPLLRAGETHNGQIGRYAANVDRALKFLLNNLDKEGKFANGMGYYQGIASLGLCEAYARTADPALKEPAQRCIDYMVKAQGANGGWRYQAGQNGDTSITTWILQALKVGENAGLTVPKETWAKAAKYLDTVAAPHGGFGYTGPQPTPTMTASGCLGRLLLGTSLKDEHLKKSIDLMAKLPPNRELRNVYYYYHTTQVMDRLDKSVRDPWNRDVWSIVLEKQEKGGEHDGSWPEAGDAFGSSSGRVMTTSLSLLMLELQYPREQRMAPLPPRELKAEEVQLRWAGLTSANVFQATEHVRVLAAAPAQTVPYLTDRLRPVPHPDAKHIARLIAELDNNRFEVRQKAEEELEKLGELASAALEQSLQDKPPLEVEQRVGRLLSRISGGSLSPEQLQILRAIHVLERVGTPEARKLLERIAAGAPGAQVTRAAAAALERVAKQKAAPMKSE
ncbi:MAG: terpene cyclase/mutase family protein [Gemmataceae bacterium]|nr:terpene cyclase/mutase family protein [Gemmataceae bacterium]